MRYQGALIFAAFLLASTARADESLEAKALRAALDLAWAHSSPEAARELGPRALELVDCVARRRGDPAFLASSAEAVTAFSFAFRHETDVSSAVELYRRGFDYACRALSPDGSFALAARTGGEAFDRELARRRREDLHALYWGAVAWGARLDLERDEIETPAELPSAIAMMKRVRELEPDMEYGGPDLFLAHYEAILGPGLGGSTERMKAHFDECLERGGDRYLLARVQLARDYAVSVQDRRLFEETLRDVIDADPGVLPERALMNRVAQDRAATLLSRVEEFFP